jgi:hypothetical protein
MKRGARRTPTSKRKEGPLDQSPDCTENRIRGRVTEYQFAPKSALSVGSGIPVGYECCSGSGCVLLWPYAAAIG